MAIDEKALEKAYDNIPNYDCEISHFRKAVEIYEAAKTEQPVDEKSIWEKAAQMAADEADSFYEHNPPISPDGCLNLLALKFRAMAARATKRESQPGICREAFEKWCDETRNHGHNGYKNLYFDIYWKIWQAAWNARATTRESGDRCSVCGGNDKDEPCAYPGFPDNRCFRTKRLTHIEDGKDG